MKTIALLMLAGFASANPGKMSEVEVAVVDAKGAPVPEAVVFVYEAKGGPFKAPAEPYVMDQINKDFLPRTLPVLVGSTVRFPNKDGIHHHLYSFSPTKSFELPLYKGDAPKTVTFEKEGTISVGCNIHDWMRGVIIVLQNPYFTLTDAKGRATLSVPEGEAVELAVFHGRQKGSVDATLKKIPATAEGRPKVEWKIELKPAPKRR